MRVVARAKFIRLIGLGLFLLGGTTLFGQAVKLTAKFNSAYGWVKPGETYPFFVEYQAGTAGANSAAIRVTLPPSAIFVSATPAPSSGSGSQTSPLTWNLGLLAPNAGGRILIRARALGLDEDPEIIWKDISATARLSATVAGIAQPEVSAKTMGPKVTTLQTARYGERPFPVVMVQYQDIKRCTGPGQPYPECTGDHTAAALDTAINSRTSGRSLWQLYHDMSFGQLSPIGQVRPSVGSATKAFDPTYPHKFSSPTQIDGTTSGGLCTGTTLAPLRATALYPNRIENGWYVLPGTQGYYGADKTGHALLGSLTGQGLLFGIDDACGPTAKIVYDAASLADPDLDYNDFDTDKDGVVDFFNLMFAGDGGNGNTSVTGVNNVWPHKSDLQGYFIDANKERGYVSNDQLRNHEGQLMWWEDASRKKMTTTHTGIPVWVRVGPYNVNPESAVERMSVIAHEYGHSLGLPDFYSQGSRSTFGTWELMASDHAQFMTVFARQEMGWVVPQEAADGIYTLRESKTDTGTITWKRPDGTPYVLTGEGIHNADALRVQLPKKLLIDEVPSGSRAWHSGAGDDFGCPGHTLDVFLPDLQNFGSASNVTLRFKSLYEIEWDWDYGFVLVSTDGGHTWTSLASKNGTTLDGHNPNNYECYAMYGNGITGVSGQRNETTNLARVLGEYPEPVWIDDEFDLTPYKGQNILLRFAYFTDPYETKRGWFIDDLTITADGTSVYRSDFESDEHTRLFSGGWSRVSSADGVDVDHAYYVELRDRVSWDKNGKGQSERGEPTWAPGLAILYTDENHGYGNTRNVDQPAQTIVDSQPQAGNTNPNLDDAAFTLDERFDGCTHVDNYTVAGGGNWKLPNGLSLTIRSMGGFSPDGIASDAVATIAAEVDPDCSIVHAPPVLRFGAGHHDPSANGAVSLEWDRPAGANGPDQLQEATLLQTLVEDDAENGLGQWTTSVSGTGAFAWEISEQKKSSGAASFWGRTLENATDVSASLTLAQPVTLPSAGTATLTFADWYLNEGDDKVAVEVSEDGSTWDVVYEGSRSELAPDAALPYLEEALTPRSVSLEAYKGRTIHLRFRVVAGAENRAGSTPFGWYVDDVSIESANWYDVATTPATAFTREGLTTGTYHYRVRTSFGSGEAGMPSPWSNIVSTRVEYTPPALKPDLTVTAIRARNNKGSASTRVTVTAVITNGGDAAAEASQTQFVLNGTTPLATVATPALAPGGSVEVTLQWDTRGLKDQQTISVTADDTNVVDESNEANNASSASFTLKGGRV